MASSAPRSARPPIAWTAPRRPAAAAGGPSARGPSGPAARLPGSPGPSSGPSRVGGGLILVAPWLRSVTFGTPVLDAPLTPFLGSAQNVYYAVVPWLAYPLAGAVFGSMMARAPDRTALFRRGAAVGLVLLGVGSVL